MGILVPGTTSWWEAIPAFVMALVLLFVPGTAAALAARVRPLAAVTVGPVLSTTFLTFSGVVCGALGIRWTVPVLVASLVVCVVVAGGLGRLLSRRQPPDEAGPLVATAVGLALALGIFLVSMYPQIQTPEAIPQHPDTIFHLGAAQLMLARGDISVLHAAGFILPSGTGFYPAAFHDFTASIALLTGSSVVVASSVFVIAIAGVAWPLGCVGLALSVLGRRRSVAVAAAVASVCFTGFPYFLMGFGVLWPNLFGQALLPSVLLLVVSALGSLAPQPYAAAPRRTSVYLLLVSLPGLALAHPNALIAFGVFAAVLLLGRLLARAWRGRAHRRVVLVNTGAAIAIVAIAMAGFSLRSSSMFHTGAPGPELTANEAFRDMVLFAPRETNELALLAVFVFAGAAVMLVRHRGSRWLVAGLGIFLALFWVNVAVDSPTARFFTWPWYNNAVRLQSVAILPAAIAAAATFVYLGDVVARAARRPQTSLAVSSVVLVAFLGVTHGYIGPHRNILHRYFHPKPAYSWVTDQELRSLRALSQHIPPGDVVAANPWNGGTYLYVVSGRRLLVPTEKANMGHDRQLLSLHLNTVGTDPAVCAAAERSHVVWAITGGQPFSWVGNQMRLYAGIDHVGTSPAWKRVATSAPYTLYQRVACARP